jgi:hypothetical protein
MSWRLLIFSLVFVLALNWQLSIAQVPRSNDSLEAWSAEQVGRLGQSETIFRAICCKVPAIIKFESFSLAGNAMWQLFSLIPPTSYLAPNSLPPPVY